MTEWSREVIRIICLSFFFDVSKSQHFVLVFFHSFSRGKMAPFRPNFNLEQDYAMLAAIFW